MEAVAWQCREERFLELSVKFKLKVELKEKKKKNGVTVSRSEAFETRWHDDGIIEIRSERIYEFSRETSNCRSLREKPEISRRTALFNEDAMN